MRVDYPAPARAVDALTGDETGVVAPSLLEIGPFQRKHGCLAIPLDRGVCGAAARTGGIQIVDDVDAFPRHIACSSATRPEPVLPLRDKSGAPIDVIDIEKDHPAAFTRADVEALGAILEATFAAGP